MCTSPNYVVWNGEYKFRSKLVKTLIEDKTDSLTKLPSDYHLKMVTDESLLCPKFDFIGKQPYSRMVELKSPWIQVPCGQCLECRIQQARTWADRVVLESKQYKYNYFITLTYDDSHLPDKLSLVPDDLSKFVKNVRNKFRDTKVRFFGCGEYGDISRRPHYHIILFNCPLDDLSYDFKQAEFDSNGNFKRLVSHLRPNNNNDLKYSELIHSCWGFKGMISVGEVTYDSAAYVSQYVTKKHKPGMADFYKSLDIEPEFVRMSTHPGIAHDYYDDKDDYLSFQGDMIVPSKGEAHISTLPRYFDKLFIKKYGDNLFQPVRDKRYKERINQVNKNCVNGLDKDLVSFNRDYKIKKVHHLKEQL